MDKQYLSATKCARVHQKKKKITYILIVNSSQGGERVCVCVWNSWYLTKGPAPLGTSLVWCQTRMRRTFTPQILRAPPPNINPIQRGERSTLEHLLWRFNKKRKINYVATVLCATHFVRYTHIIFFAPLIKQTTRLIWIETGGRFACALPAHTNSIEYIINKHLCGVRTLSILVIEN